MEQKLKAEWVAAKLTSIEIQVNKILKILEAKKPHTAKAVEVEKPKLRADFRQDPETGEITAFIKPNEEPMIGIRDLIAGEKE